MWNKLPSVSNTWSSCVWAAGIMSTAIAKGSRTICILPQLSAIKWARDNVQSLNHFTTSNTRVMICQKCAFRFRKLPTTRFIWCAQHSSVINHRYLMPKSRLIFLPSGPSLVHQAITTTPNLLYMYCISDSTISSIWSPAFSFPDISCVFTR